MTRSRQIPPARRNLTLLSVAILAVSGLAVADTGDLPIDVRKFQLVKSESGPINYYTVQEEPGATFLHSAYHPPLKTAVMGFQFPDDYRQGAHKLRWRWRAMKSPVGGNECVDGKGDSAAVVYVTWKSGWRWYSLKYVWSPAAPKGAVCDRKRNPFLAQDTIVLQSGPGTGGWVTEQLDPTAEFRKHFRDGDPTADVPDMAGIAIMSDGDQTNSESWADFADFVIGR